MWGRAKKMQMNYKRGKATLLKQFPRESDRERRSYNIAGSIIISIMSQSRRVMRQEALVRGAYNI